MYEEQYKAVAGNVIYAARTWHCYLLINKRAVRGDSAYDALNKSAQFWNDYSYMSLQTVIIFLGKIFDNQSGTHNLPKLLETTKSSLAYFSKENLRNRKIRNAGEFDGLDEYIAKAHELSESDIIGIQSYADMAIALWKGKIEPLRHRVYAHNQALTKEQRSKLYSRVKSDEITEALQILLNIVNVLEQAEINGREPDLSFNFQDPIRAAEDETGRLFKVLVGTGTESE